MGPGPPFEARRSFLIRQNEQRGFSGHCPCAVTRERRWAGNRAGFARMSPHAAAQEAGPREDGGGGPGSPVPPAAALLLLGKGTRCPGRRTGSVCQPLPGEGAAAHRGATQGPRGTGPWSPPPPVAEPPPSVLTHPPRIQAGPELAPWGPWPLPSPHTGHSPSGGHACCWGRGRMQPRPPKALASGGAT